MPARAEKQFEKQLQTASDPHQAMMLNLFDCKVNGSMLQRKNHATQRRNAAQHGMLSLYTRERNHLPK